MPGDRRGQGKEIGGVPLYTTTSRGMEGRFSSPILAQHPPQAWQTRAKLPLALRFPQPQRGGSLVDGPAPPRGSDTAHRAGAPGAGTAAWGCFLSPARLHPSPVGSCLRPERGAPPPGLPYKGGPVWRLLCSPSSERHRRGRSAAQAGCLPSWLRSFLGKPGIRHKDPAAGEEEIRAG